MRGLPLVVLLLVASCSLNNGSGPTAVLQVPACAEAGKAVTLDASQSSDPDGAIVRYVFTIDHHEAPVVSKKPVVAFTFDKPATVHGDWVTYQVLLTVVDDEGLSAHAHGEVAVVLDYAQCPAEFPAPADVGTEPDGVDAVEGDQAVGDAAADAVSGDVADTGGADTGTGDGGAGDLVADVPVNCIDLEGKYALSLLCDGQFVVEQLELQLYQQGCSLEDSLDILDSGTVDEEGNVTVVSTHAGSTIGTCSGLAKEGEPDLTLFCENGCQLFLDPA